MLMRSFICVLLRRRSSEPPPFSSGSAEVCFERATLGRRPGAALTTPLGSSYRFGFRRSGSLLDELGRFLRVRHVGHMARLHFDSLGFGALCHHALLIRIDRSVFTGHHVPGGLVLPRGILNLMGERVSRNRHLRYSHELRLIPWDVRCEVSHEMRLVYPPKPVAVRCESLGRLRQRLFDRRTAFTFIESEGGDINQRSNVWMIVGLG